MPGVECFTPDGAFYVFPKVSALYGKSATVDGKTYKINTCDDLVMYLLGMFADAYVDYANVHVTV
jgi:aspartate aminotransferase